MSARSLKRRLVAIQALTILIALAATGLVLATLFERHVERRIGRELDTYLAQIAASLLFDAAGQPTLDVGLADPRFDSIFGGLYWQVEDQTSALSARSRSLWDTRLALPADQLEFGKVHVHTLAGPQGSTLLVHERRLRFKAPPGEQVVRLAVAIDRAELSRSRAEFASDVAIMLLLLGGMLLLAGWVQIMIGLGPLSLVQASIKAIRSGARSRIDADMPREVMPLAEEVNNLLAAQEAAIERARHRADNLAHGFKTPLTALNSDIARLRERGAADIADDIEALSLQMRRQIERELVHSRLRERKLMAPVAVLPVVNSIVATLRRTPKGEHAQFEIAVPAGVSVRADKDDLTEILGNLIENAVKHGGRRVRIGIAAGEGGVGFDIEDDGKGISEAKRGAVLQRGVRLDQKVAGTGLGLAIVGDLLDAYGESLRLDTSALGGLKAQFRLPAGTTS